MSFNKINSNLSINTTEKAKKNTYQTKNSVTKQSMTHAITSCIMLMLLSTQGTHANQNIYPTQGFALSNPLAFQKNLTCPIGRTENLQLETYWLEREFGQKINIELTDPILIEFQEKVIDILNSRKNSYKTADSGVHKAPILYDTHTDEPIGIIKGQKGQWFVTCSFGDVIAYKLDHNSYAGVPPAFEITSIQTSEEKRIEYPEGVIVKWIPKSHQITTLELRTANVEKGQAIAILDIRLGNKDRHLGNIQINDQGEIYPIDHDLIFTQYKRSVASAYAVYYEKPLTSLAKKYISSLDINRDVEILRQHDIDEEEIANLVIRTTFLKLAAEAPDSDEILLENVEDAVANAKLPTGNTGRFLQNWLYEHPLRKILNGLQAPYDEQQLKEAFRDTFYSYIASAKKWSYYTYLIKSIVRSII